MKVEFLKDFGYTDNEVKRVKKGDCESVPDFLAEQWIEKGICKKYTSKKK